MSADEAVIDDEAVSVAPWRLASLHVPFYVLCLVATLGLRSPIWLLLVLLYCGFHRDALVGRSSYPLWLWRALWGCILLSAGCCIGVNVLTLQVQTDAAYHVVWNLLAPLWQVVGVQQWNATEWLDTILLPAISTALLATYVYYMKHQGVRGLRARRSGTEAALSQRASWHVQWPRFTAVCRLAAAPLLAVLAWSVAWLAPPSCVGLWLEVTTFAFIGTFFYATHPPRWVSSPRYTRSGRRGRTTTAAVVNTAFGAMIAVLIVCVCVTHNAAFTPLLYAHRSLCMQIGVGHIALRSEEGARRAVQLLGMVVLVSGAAVMNAHVIPSHASAEQERRGLLVAVEEEEDTTEGVRRHVDSAVPQPDPARSQRGFPGEAQGPSFAASTAPSLRSLLFQTKYLYQVVVVVCLMALLLHGVCFPSLVSVALWLVHFSCCAGGLVSRPQQPTVGLSWALCGCILALSCAIVAQYVCVVLCVNPSTAAWAWQPALPYHLEESGAVAAQVIGEHGIALLLQLYLFTRERTPPVSETEANSDGRGDAPFAAAALTQTTSPPPAEDDGENSGDSPRRRWMLTQLRNAAGSPKEIRKIFEAAVGRSPRSAELDRLVTSASSSTPVRFFVARHLSMREAFDYIASGPLYTYTIVISLFVFGTSSASIDLLHATCLVLSLLFSIVGSNAVLYRRLRVVPSVWVAAVMGLQLGYRILIAGQGDPSSDLPPPSPGNVRGSYLGISALEWKEVVPNLAVQPVLLWCYRYEPYLIADWTKVWQCLVFRCRWMQLLRFVHRAAGLVVLMWIVFFLPRSVNVTLLVLLLFCTALLHHLHLHRLAYVCRRFLIVGYCGAVLLAMLLVEFSPMQPWLWRVLRALNCPVGLEGVCARDIGLPSETTVWLTPLSLPWWFAIVLATAAGTAYALPTNLESASSPLSFASLPSFTSPAPPTGEVLRGWRSWCSQWRPQLRFAMLTALLLFSMMYVAVRQPSLLTAAYLSGPLWGISPTWTFSVAAVHTALQCAYQLWFSPLWLDSYMLWGTPIAELIGLWRAVSSPLPTSIATPDDGAAAPSTLAVAAAPLLIGMLQALQQHQLPIAVSDHEHDSSSAGSSSNSMFTSPIGRALRRLCASHLYVLLLLCLLCSTQRFVMGWAVAVLLSVLWWAADLRECGVLLRQRWLYRLCATATVSLAMTSYALHWIHERFLHWLVQQQFPWLMGSGEGVALPTVCWTAAGACLALQWSSGADPEVTNANGTHAESLFSHPHSENFIAWLRQHIDRHRGGYGIRVENSISDFTPQQRDAFLADAAKLLGEPGNTHAGEEDEGREEQSDAALLTHLAASSPCSTHAWSITVLQAVHLVPFVACGIVSVAAASSPPCLLSALLLLTGQLMALRHAQLQWCFWYWWWPLLVGCAMLPLSALLLGLPTVYSAVVALPPWIGLVIGLSDDAPPHVSGEVFRFTVFHVALFFALWVQGCVYSNPQWGVRLLRLQFSEKQLGEKRHTALQQQLAVRVARARAEALRADCEIRAYLDALRAGDDVTEVSVPSERVYGRGSAAEQEEGDGGGEEKRDEVVRQLRDFGAEMDVLQPPRPPPPVRIEEEQRGESEEALLPSSSQSIAAVTNAERGGSSSAAETSLTPSEENPPCSLVWQWWRQRCDSGLRWACNKLAAYTYHPSEYRVCATAAAVTEASAAGSGSALLSLRQLFKRLVRIAVQVTLRHTPLVLLACVLTNAIVTGCVWELLGLCYVVQIALAYHPYAPRIVYQRFGLYVMTGVLLKQLVVLWVAFDTGGTVPIFFAGTLLPFQRSSAHPWSGAAATPDSLRYHSLWVDIMTLGVLALHEHVCVIHGVYVDSRSVRETALCVSNTQTSSAAVTAHSNEEDSNSPIAAAASARAAPASATRSLHWEAPPSQDARNRCCAGDASPSHYANAASVPGVGQDWYVSYTSIDVLALFVLVVTYSHMTANEKLTLQDNVKDNQLPGPMALLLCMSVLQLVADRMFFVQRCTRLKAAANWVSALVYCLLYWWWRSTVAVSAHAAGNVYFTLKIVALVFSVTQVCHDYPLHHRRDAFMTHPGSLFCYSCFMVFRAIPFLWEVRTLIDWTVLHTALTLQEYLTLEDICVYIYNCRERYVGKRNAPARIGDPVTPMAKWVFGVSRLALVLLALLGPLLYYSTYNPSAVVNKATQLNLELSFFGAYDFFSTTVQDNTTVPDGWWSWLARSRPTLALHGQAATEQTVQLMEFTSCSGSQWTASPQAMRQVLAGLRAAADAVGEEKDSGGEGEVATTAYILQSIEMTRSASNEISTTSVSLVNRWLIPKATAQAMMRILEREMGVSTTAQPYSMSSAGDSDSEPTSAVLPFFYSPFSFNRASRLDLLPTDARFPHRNRQHCALELHHERDAVLNTTVRYWCLHCAPLFPAGNIPSADTCSAAEWHCLTTGRGCDDFNYEDMNTSLRGLWSRLPSMLKVPIYVVVFSDSVVAGISFLRGIGIVALYTTFVLALGRLLRSVLANKVSTLLFENMANPAVLENMVRCIGIAREYGVLRLERTIYLELIDLLRSPDRLFEVTGSLRCMHVDAGQDSVFPLGQVRRRGTHRGLESNGAAVSAGGGRKDREATPAVGDAPP
ncbi:putative transmembrane protein [Leptomonas seymouri]|uniref:Putative transmembrane protein n=1 Tax=Leptomonas seymouri TaxID=5684 RepID=A0A0N0P692_LEPSE|nr:putative transmembrane protein [Leptomonas seymouri]|eukprot:KPI87366.1 putative transmembrane protein [Leptomonas seymouri]